MPQAAASPGVRYCKWPAARRLHCRVGWCLFCCFCDVPGRALPQSMKCATAPVGAAAVPRIRQEGRWTLGPCPLTAPWPRRKGRHNDCNASYLSGSARSGCAGLRTCHLVDGAYRRHRPGSRRTGNHDNVRAHTAQTQSRNRAGPTHEAPPTAATGSSTGTDVSPPATHEARHRDAPRHQ